MLAVVLAAIAATVVEATGVVAEVVVNDVEN